LSATCFYKGWRCGISPGIGGYYTGEEMTTEQLENLFEEWSIYSSYQQRNIISEFLGIAKDGNGDLLEFLKDKLEIEGYWKKVGLA
jgi:hypothetical protein